MRLHVHLPLCTLLHRRVNVEQLGLILEKSMIIDDGIDVTPKVILEMRDDDIEVLTKMAVESEATGYKRWPMVASVILKRKQAGLAIPQALADALPLENISLSSTWIDETIRAAGGKEFRVESLYGAARAVSCRRVMRVHS